jgi:tetratricopeptide (TPR) repeat protein
MRRSLKIPTASVRLTTLPAFALIIALAGSTSGQSPEELFQTGRYDEAAAAARAEVERGVWNEKWPRLLMQAQMARGQYAAAVETYDRAARRYSNSLVLRMLAREALLAVGQTESAESEADEIFSILQRPAGRFATSDNLVAAGRYFVVRREDARQILQLFYDRVRAAEPDHVEAAIATAELALDKGDFRVAAQTLGEAKKLDDGDPRIDYLLWRAHSPNNPQRAATALRQAVSRNPNHVPSLLAMADTAIDRERYAEAESILSQVLQINLNQNEAWAYLAVIAHLRGHQEIETLMRAAALSGWAENPDVDHLIGRKLSQSYRFAEGARYQRQALALDPEHTGARFRLAEDLLRLGEDDSGWDLAKSVADKDPYNVVAYNLVTLYDRLQNFATIRADGLLVRMDPREAAIYGDSVLQLLTQARATLCEKYRIDPQANIVVEIFPQQKDFAIRTFGLPGGDGFLGVCFGRLITANSPASQGERPSNWQSVLWHEFCHAVTLEKTKNRMPRWLSEGLSVYEERQRDPASGESMTPRYRELLLDESLTPVSRLSAAFLDPPTPLHLQFAYYQSSLVIEFLVANHGFDSIIRILDDLADGIAINDALARSVGSVEELDRRFQAYARDQAEAFGRSADWSSAGLPLRTSAEQWAQWVEEHPDHVGGLTRFAESLITAGREAEAILPLENLVRLEAVTGQRSGPLEWLAAAYRKAGRVDDERRTLAKLVSLADDALPALARLAELAIADEDWASLAVYGDKILAIQPLAPMGYRFVATAAQRMRRPADAVRALSVLQRFDPVDPAELDYRIAMAKSELGDTRQATDHLIDALREAPRFRDALRLLRQLHPDEPESPAADSGENATPAPEE